MTIATSINSELFKAEFTINTTTSGDQVLFDAIATADGGFAVIYGNADGTARVEQLDSALNLTDSTLMSGVNLPGGAFSVTDAALTQTPDGFLMAVLDVADQGGGFVAFEFGRNQNGEQTFPDDYVITTNALAINPDATALNNGTVIVGYGIDFGNIFDAARFLEVDGANNSATDNLLDGAQNFDVAAAALEGGGFVVAYVQGEGVFQNSPSTGEITFQRFDANGNAVGGKVQPYTQQFAGDIEGVELVGLPGGGFAMLIDDGQGLALQVFDVAGNNVTSGGAQTFPGRSSDAERDVSLTLVDDRYILLSYTFPFSGSATDEDVRGQLFELDGTLIGNTFTLAASGAGERDAVIAAAQTDNGIFLTTYTDDSTGGDASGSAIRGVARQIVRDHQGDNSDDNFFDLEFSVEPDLRNNFRDVMRGGGGSDFLVGFGGRDDLFGDDGDDILFLFEGDDQFGAEVYSGGADRDFLRLVVNDGDTGVFDLTDDSISSIEGFEFQILADSFPSVNVTLNASQIGGGITKAAEFGVVGTNGATEVQFTINADSGTLDLGSLTFGNFGDANDAIVINMADSGGINVLTGSGVNDLINGSSGNDFILLDANDGRDTVLGGAGADSILIRDGSDDTTNDVFDGGENNDALTVTFSQGAVFDLTDDTVLNFEEYQIIDGGNGSDDVNFILNASQLQGSGASRTGLFVINSTATPDDVTLTLNADLGTLDLSGVGATGFDTPDNRFLVQGGSGALTVAGGNFDKEIAGGNSADSLSGGTAADTLLGGGGVDTLRGGAGDDFIVVGQGDDASGPEIYDGGANTDTLRVRVENGDSGVFDFTNDTIISIERFGVLGGAGTPDVDVTLNASQLPVGINKVVEFVTVDTEAAVGVTFRINADEGDIDLSAVTFDGFGDANDRIVVELEDGGGSVVTGTSVRDEINGGDGADTIDGGGGTDTLRGGAGDDRIIIVEDDPLSGTKTIDGGDDTDTLVIGTGSALDDSVLNFDLDFSTILSIERVALLDPGARGQLTLELSSTQFGELGIAGNAQFEFDTFGDSRETIEVDMRGTRLDLSGLTFAGASSSGRFVVDGDDHTDETIIGSGLVDVLNGGGGADTLRSEGGNDVINGGADADRINSGAGEDLVSGGTGDDILIGLGGDDELSGDENNDTILAGDGDDTIFGGIGDDRVLAGRDNDLAEGGAGEDVLRGAGGNDTLSGGTEDDILLGQAGNDQLFGEQGNDTLSGGAENDLLVGGDGLDVMRGETGNDTLQGGADRDRMFGGSGFDTLEGQGGNDVMRGEEGSDSMTGGTGDDLLLGGTGNDTLFGGENADRLFGDANRDILDGGIGDDTIVGGRAADTLTGGTGADRFEFSIGDGNDRILDFDVVEDILEFTGQAEADLTINAVGGNARIVYNGGSVTLEGVDAAALDPTSFEFG